MRILTGISGIDNFRRILPGELYFLIGRFTGEEELVLRIAHATAIVRGGRVVVLSPSRSVETVRCRFLQHHLHARRPRSEEFDLPDEERRRVALAEFSAADLAFVDDSSGQPIMLFEAYHRARMFGGVDLFVVLDHHGLGPHIDHTFGGRSTVASRLAMLRQLGRQFAAPVLVVTQACRRFDERPLRSCNAIKGGARIAALAHGAIVVRDSVRQTVKSAADWHFSLADDSWAVLRKSQQAQARWESVVDRSTWDDVYTGRTPIKSG